MTATLESLLSGDTPAGLFEWDGPSGCDIAEAARVAGWTVRELDTHQTHDAASFYDQLVTQWDLPDWFGRNLDALWDVLGDLATTPLLVTWSGLGELAESDPQLAQVIVELMRDASTQAASLAVVVERPSGLAALGVSDLDALL